MEPADPAESLPASSAVVPSAIAPVDPAPVGSSLPPEGPSLPALPASVGELTGRSTATSAPAPPLLDDPPSLATGSSVTLASLEEMARQAASSTSRDDLWRPIARALAVFMLALFSLRIVFDDLLPRIVLVGVLGACAAVMLAMALHAVALARRQRVLLLALTQLTRLARTDPHMAATLAPRIDGVLSALQSEPRVWPFALAPRADR